MKPWEIWQYPFPWGEHPAVIVSNAVRVARKEEIVVLACRSLQLAMFREPVETECLLDVADGLSWKTLCRCDLLFTIKKAGLVHYLGEVRFERRRDIARKIQQGLAIAGL